MRAPSNGTEMITTKIGLSELITAATPPGSRYAARKSSGNRPEAYSTDKIRKRNSQFRGGRLLPMINTKPVGSDRIKAASSGRPGGRKLLVRRYVVPKMIGVSAARYAHRLEAA